jgi:hypothetical protein
MTALQLKCYTELVPLQRELALLARSHNALRQTTRTYIVTLANSLVTAASKRLVHAKGKITVANKTATVILIPQKTVERAFWSLHQLERQYIATQNLVSALTTELRAYGGPQEKTLAHANQLLSDISQTISTAQQELEQIGNKYAPIEFSTFLKNTTKTLANKLKGRFTAVSLSLVAVPYNLTVAYSGIICFKQLSGTDGYIWDQYWLTITDFSDGIGVDTSSSLFPPLLPRLTVPLANKRAVHRALIERLAGDNINLELSK